MKYKIIVTGILKYNNKYLAVKRSNEDEYYPGSWEFPGGNIENETLLEGLKREIKEEIGITLTNEDIRVINYYDEIKNNTHIIELDFLININKEVKIKLSNEHTDYKWLDKDSELLDEFIKNKMKYI